MIKQGRKRAQINIKMGTFGEREKMPLGYVSINF